LSRLRGLSLRHLLGNLVGTLLVQCRHDL
jgi:hypothetical protein